MLTSSIRHRRVLPPYMRIGLGVIGANCLHVVFNIILKINNNLDIRNA